MIEGIARRDRLVVLAGLVVAAALAWLYLIDMALDMGGDMAAGSGAMMRMQAWSLGHGVLMWAMWAVMMVAMMVPSAAPMNPHLRPGGPLQERRRAVCRHHALRARLRGGLGRVQRGRHGDAGGGCRARRCSRR